MLSSTFVPYPFIRSSPKDMEQAADRFYTKMNTRRSIRSFSDEPVPKSLIEKAILTASTAPSGAHRQPWKFVAISNDAVKRKIRVAAEKEEQAFYEGGKTPEAWLDALTPFGTDWQKPFLETAPWLVVVFEELHGHDAAGKIRKNYYVKESVGIACGVFITALHTMGLATLTHTPAPMSFLSTLLNRPNNERPFILFPIGYPAEGTTVPKLARKRLEEVSVWL